MLEQTGSRTQERNEEVGNLTLVQLRHSDLLASLRQINGRMTRELLNSPDTLKLAGLEDAPMPVSLRRFCELMAPYLCMN